MPAPPMRTENGAHGSPDLTRGVPMWTRGRRASTPSRFGAKNHIANRRARDQVSKKTGDVSLQEMSEVEALLSVDRGVMPPSTVAFFERDPAAEDRLSHALLAATAGFAAAMAAVAMVDLRVTALFVIIAAILIVMATPTVGARSEDADARTGKRFVTVVTPQGIIVRDARGLRTWRWGELQGVVSASHGPRPYIVLVDHDGRRHALDYLSFQRGEALRDAIGRRLRLDAST